MPKFTLPTPYELARDRAKGRVREAVHLALAGGLLERQQCEVCGLAHVQHNTPSAVVAHHDDYNRPLDVRWLCNRHHRLWHARHKAVDPHDGVFELPGLEHLRIGLEQHPEIAFSPTLLKRDTRKQRFGRRMTAIERLKKTRKKHQPKGENR
jgi:hypothetical protein